MIKGIDPNYRLTCALDEDTGDADAPNKIMNSICKCLIVFVAAAALLSVPASGAPATKNLSCILAAQTASGKTIDISAVPGWKVVYFWSAACPCVRACQKFSFVPLARKYRGKIAFYAVASDGWDLSLPKAQLAKAIAADRLPYPVLLDKTHAIAKALHAECTPQTFVIGPTGKVYFLGMPDDSRRFDYDKPGSEYLSPALADALAGRPVPNSPLKEAGCIVAW